MSTYIRQQTKYMSGSGTYRYIFETRNNSNSSSPNGGLESDSFVSQAVCRFQCFDTGLISFCFECRGVDYWKDVEHELKKPKSDGPR